MARFSGRTRKAVLVSNTGADENVSLKISQAVSSSFILHRRRFLET
jgi:hypothetical protein